MDRIFVETRPGVGFHLAEGKIVAVDAPLPEGAPRVDAIGREVTPGRVCAHTHLYSGLAPFGLPAPEPAPENFVQILERVWWRLDRVLDESSLRHSARYALALALQAGTTTLIDHHESPNFIEGSLDVLAEAASSLGPRLLACYGATERNYGLVEAKRGLAECDRFLREQQGETLVGAVALHASFTVSDGTIREAGRLCRERAAVMHVHLAEAASDVEDAKQRGYAGPLQRLIELDALPEGSILAHGIYLSEEEVRMASDRGCFFVQNPRSNEGNQVGYPDALSVSDRVALGTDGYPADMIEEEAALLSLAAARAQAPEEQLRAAKERLRAGQRLAAERFGGRGHFGRLEEGAVADLVVWEDSAQRRAREVVVGGRLVLSEGELVFASLKTIASAAEHEAERLFSMMRALPT